MRGIELDVTAAVRGVIFRKSECGHFAGGLLVVEERDPFAWLMF